MERRAEGKQGRRWRRGGREGGCEGGSEGVREGGREGRWRERGEREGEGGRERKVLHEMYLRLIAATDTREKWQPKTS